MKDWFSMAYIQRSHLMDTRLLVDFLWTLEARFLPPQRSLPCRSFSMRKHPLGTCTYALPSLKSLPKTYALGSPWHSALIVLKFSDLHSSSHSYTMGSYKVSQWGLTMGSYKALAYVQSQCSTESLGACAPTLPPRHPRSG